MLATLAFVALQPEILKGLKTRTPILTFHDIIERRDKNALWFDCTTDEFRGILEWLRSRHASFISLDALYNHLTRGAELPRRAVAITFADNYEGFYLRALPILRKLQIPVEQFVHTGYVGSPIGRPKMTWAQLRELDREGVVTIGSQTVSHPADLRSLSDPKLAQEMAGSKHMLESQLGHPVPYLAYPNGKWNERALAAARSAGYLMAFTEELRPAEQTRSIFAVPRYVHTKYRQAWRDAYGGASASN
jgi:peptidoglycan/xylan/chitin deacetylase (PgdA/CDA1 family)